MCDFLYRLFVTSGFDEGRKKPAEFVHRAVQILSNKASHVVLSRPEPSSDFGLNAKVAS